MQYSHSDNFEVNKEYMSILDQYSPDYLFVTEYDQERTFKAFSLILGGGFPNTNWITVAYYLENFSESNNEYDSYTFGCVYRENVVNGPDIYHVGTYYIDSSCLLTLEDEFVYHDHILKYYVTNIESFIQNSHQTVEKRKGYIKELVDNKVEIVPYAIAEISQLNYFKSKVLLMRKLKKAQDLINSKKKGDPVGNTDDVIISKLRDQLATAEHQLTLFVDNETSLANTSKMEEYVVKIKDLNEQLNRTKVNDQKLSEHVERLTGITSDLEKKANKKTAENLDKTEQIEKLKISLNNYKNVEKECSDFKDMFSKESQDCIVAVDKLKAEKYMTQQLQIEVGKLNAEKSALTGLLSSDQKILLDSSGILETTKKEHASQVSTFEKKIEELNANNSKIQKENIEAIAKVSAQEIATENLKNNLLTTTSKCDQLTKEITDLKEKNFELNILKNSIQGFVDKIDDLEKTIENQKPDMIKYEKLNAFSQKQQEYNLHCQRKLDAIENMAQKKNFDNILRLFRIPIDVMGKPLAPVKIEKIDEKKSDEEEIDEEGIDEEGIADKDKTPPTLFRRLINNLKRNNVIEVKKSSMSPDGSVKSMVIKSDPIGENIFEIASDGTGQGLSIKLVGNMEYNIFRNLIGKNIVDIADSIIPNEYTGFYSKHKWTHNLRNGLNEMKERTDFHNLIEIFTSLLDLDNAKMCTLFQKLDKGILNEVPERNDIKYLKNGLLKLLEKKYPDLEKKRLEMVTGERSSVRLNNLSNN